jgi:hypothetical protein
MSAAATPAPSDRSDFRTVTTGGAKLGVATAIAVVLFLAAARHLPPGAGRAAVEALIVLAAAVAAAFLPAWWTAARGIEGIAGAAATGLVGAVVFSVIDVAVLRPLHAYPWTWDAIGGGSSWWYLPVWWMLGTFLAWMGGIVTARRAATGAASLASVAAPTVIAALALVAVARVAVPGVALPVATGGGFSVALTALALLALARRG